MCLKLSLGTCVDDVLDQPVGGPLKVLLGHRNLDGVQLLEELKRNTSSVKWIKK